MPAQCSVSARVINLNFKVIACMIVNYDDGDTDGVVE
jgi:hypothetical protein